MFKKLFVLGLAMYLTTSSVVVAQEAAVWPAFLGAGAVRGDGMLPLEWTPSENVAWQVDVVGYGQSSPVLWGDQVFVTSVEGNKKESFHTTCLDLKTGSEVWRKTIVNSSPVDSSLYVSRAAPTPVVDAERIVVQFESGDCVAYSHAGEELWTRKLGQDYGPFVPEFGLGASPCQTESHVFVLLEQEGPSFLLALDKATGETKWKVEREPRSSWSSPAIVTVEDMPQVVVSSAGTVMGYAAESGEELWKFDDVGGNTATTPLDHGQGQFLIAASAGRQGENAVSSKKSNGLMQISRQAGKWTVERKWVSGEANPSWASPIIHQGLAYWVNRVGVVYCLDAATGEPVYTQRSKQSCWATPVPIGDKIYFFGKEGVTTVIKAGREFEVIAENQLWNPEDIKPAELSEADQANEERRRGAAMFGGPTLYGVAVADQSFIVRIGQRVYCIRE